MAINETIPIIPLDEFESKESSKKAFSTADKDKEDKAILSSLPVAIFKELDGYETQIGEAEPLPNSYVRFMERSGEELDGNFDNLKQILLNKIKK